MGEIAEMIQEGILCAECQCVIDDEECGYDGACGYPRYCRACGGQPNMNGQKPIPRPGNNRKNKRR